MVFQSTREPFRPLPAIQNTIIHILDIFNKTYENIQSPFRTYTVIKEENLRLKKEITELKLQIQKDEEIRLENKRLKNLLHVKEKGSSVVAIAKVISSGLRKWPAIILINKGKQDGIKKNMAVRTSDGLVGKVIDVLPEFSRVLLLTDPSFSVSVRIQPSRIEGIVSGKGNGQCILKYVLKEEKIEQGQLLVTSGLDGLFPEGIPVGYLDNIEGVDELFVTFNVKPVIKLNRIEEVMIIK